ncbi:L-rhamnose mutarotase [candidate division KSB1 bacterium]|nr:L-rhamnose mutarotase [candidate division KSB1 bacterium]RQW06890.1 MAG: L-rhamnose mutarotase [candidate division KSB1 bacterium]
MSTRFKRYCKTLKLRDDPALIEEYKKVHARGAVWPEITRGMKDVGIIDMEIYIAGTRLFMIMDTTPDFQHDTAMAKLATLPGQAKWEAHVAKFQKTGTETSAGEKWQLLQRIFEMDQQEESTPEQGYRKEI